MPSETPLTFQSPTSQRVQAATRGRGERRPHRFRDTEKQVLFYAHTFESSECTVAVPTSHVFSSRPPWLCLRYLLLHGRFDLYLSQV